MARKGMSGWYVDIPTELKQEFERRFVGRSKKRNITIAAIELAIREFDKIKSTSLNEEPTVSEDR